MPATTASAPGKVILFGEHAVVYGRPAIAAPISQLKARAVVSANIRGKPGEIRIEAPNIGLTAAFRDLPPGHALARVIQEVLSALNISSPPSLTLRITSSIPVASGMGSGAAVSVAMIRALSAFWGHPLPDHRVSELAFEIEKLHHGTPSGIDNTVITYAMPVFYQPGQQALIERLKLSQPVSVMIGDTGIPSPTAASVSDVRRAWQADKAGYEALFDGVAEIVRRARVSLEGANLMEMGLLMDENHAYLQRMGVSCAELDSLVEAARKAGALGAKLSGGGRGGVMIALVAPGASQAVAQALVENGAVNTYITHLQPIRGEKVG